MDKMDRNNRRNLRVSFNTFRIYCITRTKLCSLIISIDFFSRFYVNSYVIRIMGYNYTRGGLFLNHRTNKRTSYRVSWIRCFIRDQYTNRMRSCIKRDTR